MLLKISPEENTTKVQAILLEPIILFRRQINSLHYKGSTEKSGGRVTSGKGRDCQEKKTVITDLSYLLVEITIFVAVLIFKLISNTVIT